MKVVFLDYGRSQSETPERVFERLERVCTKSNIEVERNPDYAEGDYIVIRWGTTRCSELDVKAKAVLNPASAINFNLHKDQAHAKFLAEGISTPRFWNCLADAQRANVPFLRRRTKHIQGRDILLVESGRSISRPKRSGYYTEYIEKTAEYRLHILNGECIGLAQKLPKDGESANPLIWNYENGWDLFYVPNEQREHAIPYYAETLKESVKAVKCLGLDFGAVDLIMKEEKPYILEVNTAPKLHNTKRYSKNIIHWLASRTGKRMRETGSEEESEEE